MFRNGWIIHLFRIYLLCTASVALAAASGCRERADGRRDADHQTSNNARSQDGREADGRRELSFVSNTQAHLDKVAIGVGNFWADEYIVADGSKMTGQSCGVFISVKDDPASVRSIRVGRGSE